MHLIRTSMVNSVSGSKMSIKSWLEPSDNNTINNKIEVIEISLCYHGQQWTCIQEQAELSIKCIDFVRDAPKIFDFMEQFSQFKDSEAWKHSQILLPTMLISLIFICVSVVTSNLVGTKPTNKLSYHGECYHRDAEPMHVSLPRWFHQCPPLSSPAGE